MTRQTTLLVVVVLTMTVVIAGAQRNVERDVALPGASVASHYKRRPRHFFLDQEFIDKMTGRQTASSILARDQPVGQQIPLDTSAKGRGTQRPGSQTSRYRQFKQNAFQMVTTFKDEPLFKDAVPRRHLEPRGGRAVFGNGRFEEENASLAPEEIFQLQASTYRSQAPFKKQLFTAETFKNLFRGQTPSGEQASFWKQAAFAEFPPVSDSIKFHQDDAYTHGKPTYSYEREKDVQAVSYREPSMYAGYGDMFGQSSMPMISSYEHLSPSSAGIFAAPLSASTAVHESAPSMSFGSPNISEMHSSEDFKTTWRLGMATTTPRSVASSGKCNTPVDSSLATSSDAVTIMPSISVSANQSSILDHILTSLTTKPGLPVTATVTPTAPFVENMHGPIHFHATKYGAIASPSFDAQNELKSNAHTYLFPETPKTDGHDQKYLTPEVPKNDMRTGIQNLILNYVLPEEQRAGLKDDAQDTFANYALPEVLKHGWPLQQFSQLETSSGYVPWYLDEEAKLLLNLSNASAVSWPAEIKHDVHMTPAKSILASDGTMSNSLPLGMSLPSEFVASMPNSLTPSILNGISGSITGGISASIPDGMMANVPASIPTLSLEQSLHRLPRQLQQTQKTKSPWYPTG